MTSNHAERTDSYAYLVSSTVIQNYVRKQTDEQIREEQLSLWKDDSE